MRSLTGLSEHQLRYWDHTEFFHPQYADGSRAFGRIYSFRDVVGLRSIALLRKKYRVSLQELRKVGQQLLEHSNTPWASLRLYVLQRRVYFEDGRISFRCAEPRGRRRAEELIEWLEFEYLQVQKRKDRRLLVEIGEPTCVTRRSPSQGMSTG